MQDTSLQLAEETAAETRTSEDMPVSAQDTGAEITGRAIASDEISAVHEEISSAVMARRRTIFVGLLCTGSILLALSLFVNSMRGGRDALLSLFANSLFMLLFAVILPLISVLIFTPAARKARKPRKSVLLLSEQEDPRCIGPLIDAYSLQDYVGIRRTTDVLTRLLPKMKASDATLLTDTQIAKLRIHLTPIENPLYKDVGALFRPDRRRADFQIAILKAFEQVGSEKELPVVEKLAQGEARTALEKEIQSAARECLPCIRSRVEQDRLRTTLLRPADGTDDPSGALLRPAQGSAPEESRLLRPDPTEE